MDYDDDDNSPDYSDYVKPKKKKPSKKRTDAKNASKRHGEPENHHKSTGHLTQAPNIPTPIDYVPPIEVLQNNPELLNYIIKLHFNIDQMRSKINSRRSKFIEVLSSIPKYFDSKNIVISDIRAFLESLLPPAERTEITLEAPKVTQLPKSSQLSHQPSSTNLINSNQIEIPEPAKKTRGSRSNNIIQPLKEPKPPKESSRRARDRENGSYSHTNGNSIREPIHIPETPAPVVNAKKGKGRNKEVEVQPPKEEKIPEIKEKKSRKQKKKMEDDDLVINLGGTMPPQQPPPSNNKITFPKPMETQPPPTPPPASVLQTQYPSSPPPQQQVPMAQLYPQLASQMNFDNLNNGNNLLNSVVAGRAGMKIGDLFSIQQAMQLQQHHQNVFQQQQQQMKATPPGLDMPDLSALFGFPMGIYQQPNPQLNLLQQWKPFLTPDMLAKLNALGYDLGHQDKPQ